MKNLMKVAEVSSKNIKAGDQSGANKEDIQLYEKFKRTNVSEDLAQIDNPNDQAITDMLCSRFKAGNAYTYLSGTVISVNPYNEKKKLASNDEDSGLFSNDGVYHSSVKALYHKHNAYELQPHLYSLAEDVFRTMKESGKPQAVVISGESGSGKTVAARLVLEYLAAVSYAGRSTEAVRKVLTNSNPIFEAFGNAKTLRNDNSSRFGKHLELFFNFKGQLEGADITTSLLEKHRVCFQRVGERNFHIFYQLCAGADEGIKSGLGISKPAHFSYLNKNELSIKGINDRQEFRLTCQCFAEAGILAMEQMEIFRILAGILHLGNLRFGKSTNKDDKTDRAAVVTKDVIKICCQCLGIEEAELEDALLNRRIKVGVTNEINVIAQNELQASKNRDALAKDIYERLFLWLIKRVNAAVKRPDDAKFSVGILDIYGFEIYKGKDNSLEQLNINYVNEKVQQMVQKWLEREQEDYIDEGVLLPEKSVKITKSTEVLKLIEGQPIGIYSLLDDESLLKGGGSDKGYANKLHYNFDKEKFKAVYRKDKFDPLMWWCKHYADVVNYYVEDWVEKNNDTVYDDIIKCMQRATSDLMKALYPAGEKMAEQGKLQKTVAKSFQGDVGNLVGKLKGRQQHYIRCLKPNLDKKAEDFRNDIVQNQVKYLGLTEAVLIKKAGYFFKMDYDKFLDRYRACSKSTFPIWKGLPRDGTEQILKDMKLDQHAAYGKTKLFLKTPQAISELDYNVEGKRGDIVKLLQRTYKNYKLHKKLSEDKNLTMALERTYGDSGPYLYKTNLNQISQTAQRKRVMFVVTPKSCYLIDPNTYAVKRRLAFSRLNNIFCSALNDGVFGVRLERDLDEILEADNKHEVMQSIRDNYAKFYGAKDSANASSTASAGKTLQKDIGENFKYNPRKGFRQELKYRKNFAAKTTLIEYTPEGLTVSIKPSEDIFEGQKVRRRNSFNKVYYGDYLHLQNSLVMQQQRDLHGDHDVHFSSQVSKYNKIYKQQERILMITDKAAYSLDPEGFAVNRRIPLGMITSVSCSPLTDNFFIVHVGDEEGDYVYESSKKTEILKVLSEQYSQETRRHMKFNVKDVITWKKSNGKEDDIRFQEDRNVTQTILIRNKSEGGADVFVAPEASLDTNLQTELIQDIYRGQKLRRRESLLRWYMGDYLHIQNSKVMQKMTKQYKDQRIVYSGVVAKVNKRYTVQNRKMIISEKALYNMDSDGYQINRRIPLEKIESIHVSSMRDGFFIIRVPDEYDYFHTSSQKTEIIKCIMDQYKKLTGKNLPINVDDKIVYAPFGKNQGVRTIEFKEDPEIKVPTIYPTHTGVKIKINNFEEVVDAKNQMEVGIADKPDSVYSGRKYRRRNSIGREQLGDYLRLENSAILKALFKKNGDSKLLFSAEVTKINNKYKGQTRIMLITDEAVYNIDPDQFKVKRRIPLEEIEGVSVSSLTDGHFCLHMPNSFDYLYDSDKKTEILDTLSEAFKKKNKNLQVNVGDKFEFQPKHGTTTSVNFILDENSNESFLEANSNGLTVHVQHEEPSIILEAAFVHVKDQPKPIEVKSSQTIIKLRKRWKYKLEIRFYCNAHIEGCLFHEKIDTVSSRQEYVSKVGTLEKREERYVITLPERPVLFSILSKTRVKTKLVDAEGNTLLAVRFVYDVR